MSVKLKIVSGGWGIASEDVGKIVEVILVSSTQRHYKVQVAPASAFEYQTSFLSKGLPGWVSHETFGLTLEGIEKILKEDATLNNAHNDVVNSPNHYILFKDIEVKDVVKEVLRRWQDESDTDMSFNQAGMMKEALQYLLRAPKKNKKEDVEKAVYYLKAILEEWV